MKKSHYYLLLFLLVGCCVPMHGKMLKTDNDRPRVVIMTDLKPMTDVPWYMRCSTRMDGVKCHQAVIIDMLTLSLTRRKLLVHLLLPMWKNRKPYMFSSKPLIW